LTRGSACSHPDLKWQHGKIFEQRNHPENDHDDANDLSGAPVEWQHIDEIEYQNDDKERDDYANEDVHACPLSLEPLRQNRRSMKIITGFGNPGIPVEARAAGQMIANLKP
jgi:hypothetical protein